ncbi:hypothetical protein J2Z76_002599 [Sedimentibacter acidaminivorans]|uniref:DUF4320 family protein n=1 Tax=Sedimentibacter acidaminivorans TaxID=913099 RepID=A0ABS4GGA5_9FIRM|nr:hypothetical protein [Sedimentibacter acidaminivorans]MBP1926729.1 hypothetical protein [Sedimentibacter acidaminivorans]
MRKYINNEKGAFEIITFLVVLPFIIYFIVYIVIGGLFLIEKNELTTIVNKKLDQAIVVGQFTVDIKTELIQELDTKGFKQEKLEITITPAVAGDNDNNTYATRGQEISVKVIYKKAHTFYYINGKLGTENTFYPKTKGAGMSEKW